MKRKSLAAVAVLMTGMLLFTACGANAGSKEESASAGSVVEEEVAEAAEEAVSEAASTSEVAGEAAEEANDGVAEESAASEAAEEATSTSEAATESATSEEVAESTDAEETMDTASKGETPAYAWMGLQDIPQNDYLDILMSRHYIETYDYYAMGIMVEQTDAVDGVNTVTDNPNTYVYSVGGKILSMNKSAKIYMQQEMSSELMEAAEAAQQEAMASGTNMSGRTFVSTGTGTIPLYSEGGDTAEYEYYEYNYPESEAYGYKMTERYYMKDGDVFGIYQDIVYGEDGTELESLKIIKSISADIPEGTFDEPDLEGYTLYEMPSGDAD